ncbi:hypothetical protein BGZ76_009912 [Entomortierella beljakovae]|nr:hypothetical protein BGZ76_009912 [Entomortierella beljakovae]
MSSTADHPLIDEDGLSRHPWHQGHTHPIQDSSQPDNNYLQQQDTHILSHDRSHSELLQQQHMLNLQTENKSLQRQQSGGVSVRYLNESMTSHHGHYRLSLGSINTDLSTHQFNRSIHVQSNDSGIDPSPKRDETISINYSGRSHGRNKGNKGAEIEQDDTNDESVDDEHNEMEGIQSESQGRSSYHFGSRDQPFSTDRRIDDIRDDDSNDCVPSGMVGVPQDVRRFQPYNSIPQQFQGTSSSSLQNRQSQLSQQHQSHVVHPVQHAHDIFQQRYPSSPGSQPLMGTTVYHPNGHVLHNRHPMHRFSVGKTGYNYGHPNPYSLPADPNTLLSLSKGTHGSIPIFPRQLSAQPPRSHLFTGTSSIHPMEGNYDGVDESDNHGDENDAECSENDQIDDNDDDDDDDDNNNNNDDIQLNEC